VSGKSFGESFVITFLDADGTISHAGVVPPASACVAPEGSLAHSCPVVLAQHGMGVSASGMADAFKFMPSGESAYRFGVDGAWVLAPARFGAHNHEGPGAACVDAAIDALAALTSAPVEGVVSYADRRADPARIISTGHSMGVSNTHTHTQPCRAASWTRELQPCTPAPVVPVSATRSTQLFALYALLLPLCRAR